MGLQPVERRQVKPLGDRAAFGVVGDQVDALAIADPVERQPVGEIVDHRSSLRPGPRRTLLSSSFQSSRSACAQWPSASAGVARNRLSRTASSQSLRRRPRRATVDPPRERRRPACAPSCRASGSPRPSSRCSRPSPRRSARPAPTDWRAAASPPRSSRTVTSATIVASTAKRPSIVSGTWPSTYQCGCRASAAPRVEQRPRRVRPAVNRAEQEAQHSVLALSGWPGLARLCMPAHIEATRAGKPRASARAGVRGEGSI